MSVKIDDRKFDFKKTFQKAVGEPTADQDTPKPEDTKVDFKKTFQESLKKKVATPAVPEQPDTSSKDATPTQKVSLEPDNTTEVFDIQKGITDAGKKITTPTGAQIHINESKLAPLANSQSLVSDIQKRVSAGEYSPQDIEIIAESSGKKPEAVLAYLKGDNTTGESIDRKDYIDKNRESLRKAIINVNENFGKDYKPDEVLSNPQMTSDYVQLFESQLAEKNPLSQYLNPDNPRSMDQETLNAIVKSNPELQGKIDKYNKFLDDFNKINKPILLKHIEEVTAEEDFNNGVPRSVTAKKMAQRVDPVGFRNTQKALGQATGLDRLSDKSGPGQIIGSLIEELQGNSTKNTDDEALNSQIGWADIKLNEVYKNIAKDKFALAHLSGDEKMLQQAKDIYAKIDDDIGLQYPATQKYIMADHVARIIADKGGNIVREGGAMSQTETQSTDNSLRHFGAEQVKQIVTDLGWLDDPKMKDNAEWLIDHPGDIKDASTFGGLRNAVTDPIKNLGLGILDVLGVRSKRDVIADKTRDELFPTEFSDDELKTSFTVPGINQPIKARHTVNAIGGLAGMTAIAMATGGIGRAAELGLTAAESAELAAGTNAVRNAELLAKTAEASERAGAYTSFALPSIDPNLKASYDFIDNDAERAMYVTMGAILNGEGGRLLKLGNIARVPGLGEDFARIAKGLTEKTMTKEAANELLKKGENKFVDYAVKFGKNTTTGAATMAYFGFVDKVNRMAFGDPNAKAVDLLPDAGKAFVDGIFTMIPFGFVSAASAKENPNTSMKGFINDMARFPDAVKDVLKLSNLTEQQYNEKVQILNTSVAAKNALDAAQTENGLLLQPTQRAAYVANKTVESVLRAKAEKMEDGKAKNEIIKQADELNKQSVATLDGLKFTKTLEPLYDLYEAEKKYDAAYDEFNKNPTPAAENTLLKSKEAYQELQNKYFNDKYGVVDTVPSEQMAEASGIVESAIANGKMPEMMIEQMKASPIKTAQMIADQALGMGRDTEGKRQQIAGESADRPQYDKAVEQFGKEAVDKAIAMFPLEETKDESIESVNQRYYESLKKISELTGKPIGMEDPSSTPPPPAPSVLGSDLKKFDDIEKVMPDESIKGNIKRLIDVAETIPDDIYNQIGEQVKEVLKDTHFTESDYKSSIGNVYEKMQSTNQPVVNDAKETNGIPNDFAERHESILSQADADVRWSNGERIFAKSEMDEMLHEVNSKEELENYAPDQLFAYTPENTVKDISSPKTTKDGSEKNSQANAQEGSSKESSPEKESGKINDEGKPEPELGSGAPSDGNGEPPKDSAPPKSGNEKNDPGKRSFAKRVVANEEILPESRKSVADNIDYVQQTNELSVKEANEIIDKIGVDESFSLVTGNNDVKPAVRAVMGQILIKKFNDLAVKATDTATRNLYIDKTIDIANYVSEKLATEPGQMIQALSLFSRLSPEGNLRAAIKDQKKQAEPKKAKVKQDVDDIGNKLQKINEETAEEVTKSPKVKDSTKKAESKLAEKSKDKVQKAKERREKVIKKYKDDKGKNLYAGVGLTKEGIEFVGDLIKTYIDEGIGEIGLIVDKVLQELKNVTGKDVTDAVNKNVNELTKEQYDKFANIEIARGVKELEVEIGRIVRDHYTVKDIEKKTLLDKFMGELGIDKDIATELEKEIKSEFDKIATRKKEALLESEKKRWEKIQSGLKGTKKPDDIQSQIVKFSNLGAFENKELLNMLAEKLGVGQLTPEEGQRITELAQKVQNAPEGSPKKTATENLLTYRANIKGNSWGEIAQSAWYAQILSGYATHIKNLVSTFFNTMGFFGVEAIKNPTAIPHLFLGLTTGIGRIGIVEAAHTVATGQTPIHISKIETPDVLERVRFKGGWLNPANYLKYVGRLMKAEDVLLFQGLKEMRATQLALREAERLGLKEDGKFNPWSKSAFKKVNELLLNTTERYDESLKQVEQEGLKGREATRRVYELMELSRPIQMTEDAYGFAAKGTFNHETEGTLGALSDAISSILDNSLQVAGAKPLRFIIPFTRIITNVANNALDYSPVGVVRAAIGKRGWMATEKSGKRKDMTKEERQQTIVKASLGIASMGALYTMSAMGMTEVSGAGPSDLKKKLQLIEEGWQPYSIKVGNRWISYKLTPFVFAWGLVGSIRDHENYDKDADEQGFWQRTTLVAWDGIKNIGDMTWVGSAAPLMGAMASNNPDEAEKILSKTGSKTLKSFVPIIGSNFYTQTAQKIEDVFNVPQKKVDGFWESLIQDVPIARNYLNDKINVLGDPVVKDVDILYSNLKTDPVWKYLYEKKGWVAPINKNTIITFDEKTNQDRPISEDEYYEFSKVRGGIIKKEISNILQYGATIIKDGTQTQVSAKDLTTSQLQKALTVIGTQATKEAKKELFEPKMKTPREKIIVNEF